MRCGAVGCVMRSYMRAISISGHDTGEDVVILFAGTLANLATLVADAADVTGTVDTITGVIGSGSVATHSILPQTGSSPNRLYASRPSDSSAPTYNVPLENPTGLGVYYRATIPRADLDADPGVWVFWLAAAVWTSPRSNYSAFDSRGSNADRKLRDIGRAVGTPDVRAGYDSATGLLTIAEPTSSVWAIDNFSGMPSQMSVIVGGVLFDSDDYTGDFDAWKAAIAAADNVQSVEGGGGDPLVITADPGVGLLTVTDLVVTGGTATLTQTATGAFVGVAWVQYYADKECTTPRAGSMGTAAGKLGLTAAP